MRRIRSRSGSYDARAPPAARGRSRPRRADPPAGPAGPAPPASPSRNRGPAATRAAIAAVSSLSSGGAAGVDAGVMTVANLAGNKGPGERKGRRQPRSYQELCSISGTTASRRTAVTDTPPDRDRHPRNQTPGPISPETLGQWEAGPCGIWSHDQVGDAPHLLARLTFRISYVEPERGRPCRRQAVLTCEDSHVTRILWTATKEHSTE